MRRLIQFAAIIATSFALVGCDEGGSGEPRPAPSEVQFADNWETLNAYSDGSTVTAYTDEETGCEYLIYENYRMAGMTQRMEPSGTQRCRR